MGEVINNAVDIGLKSVLPDLIEDEVIDIKNTMLENGFKEGLNEAIKTVTDFGKTAMGIMTGNFENINQINIAVKKGGMIDTISNLLDNTIEKVEDKNLINKTTAKLIKKGKNNILDNISDKIEDNLEFTVLNFDNKDNSIMYNTPVFFSDLSNPVTLKFTNLLYKNYSIENTEKLSMGLWGGVSVDKACKGSRASPKL